MPPQSRAAFSCKLDINRQCADTAEQESRTRIQPGFSHGENVTVRPGETAQVIIGGKGTAVTGRIELSAPVDNHDWTSERHALVQQRPDLPELQWDDFRGDHQAYLRASSVRDSQIMKYFLAIQSDGSFRVDDVLPGNYTLQLAIHAPPDDPLAEDAWMKPRRQIGKVHLPVVIPAEEGGEPLDLGVISVPIANAAPATAVPGTGSPRIEVPFHFPKPSQ